MRAPIDIVLATTNPGKLREIQALLSGLPVEIVCLDNNSTLPQPVENADTFDGNATIKALHYAGLTKSCVLADDSGLEVDVLDQAPGVHSARYAGSNCDAAANNAKLLEALAPFGPESWTARFRCALVLAKGDKILARASGSLEGLIVEEARGENGFGYDPHFWVPSQKLTTAQMSPEQKNRISHRGQALAALKPQIERLLGK